MPRAAVAQVVAVDGGDHHVAQPEHPDRFRQMGGSFASRGFGRPCATSQNGHRRVHRSPMIMNVAVPCEKHSARFGQDASSHTLCSPCSRSNRFTRPTAGPAGARTRIHGGFLGSGPSVGITFTGMRDVLSRPRISRVGRSRGGVVETVVMSTVYETFRTLRGTIEA